MGRASVDAWRADLEERIVNKDVANVLVSKYYFEPILDHSKLIKS